MRLFPMASRRTSAAPVAYTRTAIAFHWLIAVLIACGFSLGWVMVRIPGITPDKLRYFSWHKWIGVTVFALAVLRLLWRASHAAVIFLVRSRSSEKSPPRKRSGCSLPSSKLASVTVGASPRP